MPSLVARTQTHQHTCAHLQHQMDVRNKKKPNKKILLCENKSVARAIICLQISEHENELHTFGRTQRLVVLCWQEFYSWHLEQSGPCKIEYSFMLNFSSWNLQELVDQKMECGDWKEISQTRANSIYRFWHMCEILIVQLNKCFIRCVFAFKVIADNDRKCSPTVIIK